MVFENTRYNLPLDWPLFVKLGNQCYNPDSDFVRAGHPQLGECLRTCFPKESALNNDMTRLLCHERHGTTCDISIRNCFDEVVAEHMLEQQQQEETTEEYVIQYPEDYASVLNNPGQCCNATYVTLTRDQVLNHGDTYAGSPIRASDILRQCGFVKLEGLIDRDIAMNASHAVNVTLANYTYFDDYYMASAEYGLDAGEEDEDEDEDEEEKEEEEDSRESEDMEEGGIDEHDEDDEFFVDWEVFETQERQLAKPVDKKKGSSLELQSMVEVPQYDWDGEDLPTLGQLKQWHQEQILELAKATKEGRVITDRDATHRDSKDLSNLRAGRYEMTVPPFRTEFDNLFKALRHSPIVVPVLETVWPYDDSDESMLKKGKKQQGGSPSNENLEEEDPGYHFLYANIMSQTIYGLNNAEGQTRHRDSDGCEDIKIQISIHDYTREDGGTYFQPGTHCARPDTFGDLEELFSGGINLDLEQHSPLYGIPANVCTGFAPTSMNAGDVVMYYSGTAHGGSSNFSGRRRSFIDVVVHSSANRGRPYFSSERDDRPYGTFDDNLVKLACAKAELERKAGKNKRLVEVDDETYGEQTMSSEWLCKVANNVVKAVEHQRAVFHGYDEKTDKEMRGGRKKNDGQEKRVRGKAPKKHHRETADSILESEIDDPEEL